MHVRLLLLLTPSHHASPRTHASHHNTKANDKLYNRRPEASKSVPLFENAVQSVRNYGSSKGRRNQINQQASIDDVHCTALVYKSSTPDV